MDNTNDTNPANNAAPESTPINQLLQRLRAIRRMNPSQKTAGASGGKRRHNGVRGWKRRAE